MLKRLLRRLRRLMLADVLAELAETRAQLTQLAGIRVQLAELAEIRAQLGQLAEIRAQLARNDAQLEAALLTIALNRDTSIANTCECGGKQSISMP